MVHTNVDSKIVCSDGHIYYFVISILREIVTDLNKIFVRSSSHSLGFVAVEKSFVHKPTPEKLGLGCRKKKRRNWGDTHVHAEVKEEEVNLS